MAIIVHNYWTRLADQVLAQYVAHPHLIESLLTKIGVQEMHHDHGKDIRCPCPIHGGTKLENFRIWYHLGVPRWRCFSGSCGNGDLVKLLRLKYGASYSQAVVSLARLAGMQVDGMSVHVPVETLQEESISAMERRLGIHRKTEEPKTFPEEMNERAQRFLGNRQNVHVQEYLTGPITQRARWGEKCRQLPYDIIRQFEMGFVPARSWIYEDPNEKDRRGQPKQKGWFVDRISVPWRMPDGRLIGFAGRRVDGQKDKKWHTLFGTKKSMTFYGLHYPQTLEMIRATRQVILVEGYTDVMRAWQFGLFNTISGGGTELSEEQMRLLAQFDLARAFTYMDGDDAGQIATQTIGRQLSRITNVFNAIPPIDCDPSDLVDFDSFIQPLKAALQFTPKE
jgi:DNA primase